MLRYGALDAKILSKASYPSLEFRAVAGPTHDRHPPFQWSTTNIDGVPHFRTIDKFDFQPLHTEWALSSGVKNR